MKEIIAITKALADENRLRIILALRNGELCVCQITELLELAPSTVSKHISQLKTARLIASRKRGRWVFYRLDRESASKSAKKALIWTIDSLERDGTIQNDSKKLRQILKIDPDEICRKQNQRGDKGK